MKDVRVMRDNCVVLHFKDMPQEALKQSATTEYVSVGQRAKQALTRVGQHRDAAAVLWSPNAVLHYVTALLHLVLRNHGNETM